MSGTGRITQDLVEVADSGGAGESRATQTLAEVLYNDATTGLITQSLAEVLYDFPTSARLTQVAGEVLYLDSVGGLTQSTACLLWRLRRTDGVVMRFAALDVDVTWGGEVYLAAAPFEASASEQVRTLSAGQVEVSGLIDNDEITPTELMNGLYDEAYVEVFRVDWSDPAGGAEALTAGWIGAVSSGPVRFEAEAVTPSARLDQQIVRTVTPGCNAKLGDSRCGVNLASWTQSKTITSVASRAQFTASGFTEAAGWATGGTVTFTSGPNDGAVRRIRSHASGGVITLWEPLFAIPTVGDGFDIVAGCDKRLETCRDKFSNVVNFRGFPHVKGEDSAGRYPDAR
jgi:uncharacterized phage protein (TIGR02218 family)